MNNLAIRAARRPLRQEICAWQRAALALFVLSLVWNMGQTAVVSRLSDALREAEARLEQAEWTRDYALEKLGSLALQAERDRQARTEQAAAYEAIGACTLVLPVTRR